MLSGALFQYPGAIIMTAVGVFAAEKLSKDTPALNAVASGEKHASASASASASTLPACACWVGAGWMVDGA
jgi:hypothetical protein